MREVINIAFLIFLFFESAFFAGAQAQLRGGVGVFNALLLVKYLKGEGMLCHVRCPR